MHAGYPQVVPASMERPDAGAIGDRVLPLRSTSDAGSQFRGRTPSNQTNSSPYGLPPNRRCQHGSADQVSQVHAIRSRVYLDPGVALEFDQSQDDGIPFKGKGRNESGEALGHGISTPHGGSDIRPGRTNDHESSSKGIALPAPDASTLS